ncbi:MAG: SH3 domain-containing protein [Treponema sp.]|jgi:hypothetical protein|nr:SH3 domain-containing protein [Treponema sp.]
MKNINTAFLMKHVLFCFLLMTFFASSVFSYSGPDEPLTVITETEPDIPFVGLEWKISLLVDHPEVSNVFVQTPPFPDSSVRLDRVRTEPQIMYAHNDEGETWTLVEFFFIPLKPGRVILPSFEIKTPEKSAFTSQMVFTIEAPYGSYEYQPELLWDAVPDVLAAGKASELFLLMQNNDPQKSPDDSLPIMIDIPEQAIMERLPLSSADRQKNRILRVRIIPLEEGTLSIKPVIVEYDASSFASPSLQIKVLSNSAAAVQSLPVYQLSHEELSFNLHDEENFSPEQDEASSSYIKFFPGQLRKQYDEILKSANELWDRGEKVSALAEIRKAERDLVIGFALRPLRKNLERELGLGMSDDEFSVPAKFIFILCAVFFTLSILLFCSVFLFRKKKDSSLISIVCYSAFVLCTIAALTFGIFGASAILRRSGKDAPHQVVLFQADAYRVPEENGAVSGSFKEGESGIIRSAAGEWVYVETSSGQSGWVPENRVIRY